MNQEIDHRTMKLLVGLIAILLASLTDYFSPTPLRSISESYHIGGWPESFLVGSMFAIAAFLVAYDPKPIGEKITSKIAAIAALGVALFPCEYDGYTQFVPYVHGASAAVMFLILAYFCWGFCRRAWAKRHGEAKARAAIYFLCIIGILGSIAVLAFDHFTGGSLSAIEPRLTFYGEAAGLLAFGISWLTASRAVPLISRWKDELFFPHFKVPAEPDATIATPKSTGT